MAIADDFTVFPFSKTIRHVTSATATYTVTAFYSYLMDLFDEPAFQSYESPMKFNTPTSFSMLNGWFLDNGDFSDLLNYLFGASINTIDYTTVADPVFMMDVDAETVAFVDADKDEELLDDAGAVGPLLAFKANYPTATTARFWVRDVNTNGEIAVASDITMTAPGAAAYAANTLGPSLNGNEVYSNIFTLASFPGTPDPQLYVYQAHPVSGNGRIRIAEWSGLDNWNRDPNGFDVIVPIQLGGVEIDSGDIKTFARQTADSYTFVESDLTGGARTPLATETISDGVNVAEGEHFLLVDAGTAIGTDFSVGDVIQNQSTAANNTPPTWYAEVVAVQEFTLGTTGVLAIRGLRGTIADGDGVFVGTVQEATANGTPGGTFFTWDASTTDPGDNVIDANTVLVFTGSGARRVIRGVEQFAAANQGACVCDTAGGSFATIDATDFGVAATHDSLYPVLLNDDSAADEAGGAGAALAVLVDQLYSAPFQHNTLISDFTDVTIAHLNGVVTVVVTAGTFEIGERLEYNAGAQSCIFAGWDTEFTIMQLADVDSANEPDASDDFIGISSGATADVDSGLTDDNLLNYEFTQQATGATYAVLIEGGFIYNAARSLSDIYKYWQFYVRDGQGATERNIFTSDGSTILLVAAEEYIKAVAAYTAVKPAPYGTLAGTLLFGAQGIWVQGTASVDDLRLTDNAGTAQQGTPSVLVQVTNTRVSDVINVFLEDGSTGLPDKAQFGINAVEPLGETAILMDSAIPIDTPSTGTLYIVDTDFGQFDKEHMYRYISFAGSTFTLPTGVTGTAEGTSTDTQLDDTGVFGSTQRGDIIRNTSTPAIGYVITVTGANQVITTQMRDSAGAVVPWGVDNFELHTIANATAADDTAFAPYLEAIEDVGSDGSPGTVSDTLLFLGARAVVIRVRNNLAATKIVPFVTTSDITSGGMTVSVIRTEDTVTS